MLHTLLTDLRAALRLARRQPAFAAVVVATLALGIGANTAMFALIHAALLKPLPYADPDRLVLARRTIGERLLMWNSAPDFYDYRAQATNLEELSAIGAGTFDVTLTGQGRPEVVATTVVSDDLFSTLGVSPVVGRSFAPDEGRAGAPYVAVVSDRLARRRFGDPAAALGRKLPLTGAAPSNVVATVVGVMPASFRFLYDADLWMPMRQGENDGPETRQFHNWVLVGRLKPAVPIEAAQRQVDVIAARLQQQYPSSNVGVGLRLDPLQSALLQTQRPRLLLLMGAVGLVLLIACGNVASLLLARGVTRRTELAVRSALGASRRRLVEQLLTESVLMAVVSGIAGAALAVGLERVLPVASGLAESGVAPEGLPWPILGFAVALSAATALLSGVLPALTASSLTLTSQLAHGARSTESRGSTRLRSVLLAGQVAVSLVLLVGAGLLLRTLGRLMTTDLGFEADHLLTVRIRSAETDAARRIQFYDELQRALAAVPGVTAVAFDSHVPIRDPYGDPPMWPSDRPPVDRSHTDTADMRIVLPGSVRALGIPLRSGRPLAETDRQDRPQVLVINELMARRLFPGRSVLGQRITVAGYPGTFEVVGVVGDARLEGVAQPPLMTMYASYYQIPRLSMNVLLRTTLPPGAITQTVRRIVEARDPDVPVEDLVPMTTVIGASLISPRVTAITLALFSAVALFLSSLGLYGLLTYHVSTRTQEIGVRLALGAGPSAVVRQVLGRSVRVVAPGLAIGLATALAGGRLIRGSLYEVTPTDPLTLIIVVATFGIVTLAATAYPAWRAARIDPAQALRAE